MKKVVLKDGILIFHWYFSYEKSGIKIWNLDFPLVFLMKKVVSKSGILIFYDIHIDNNKVHAANH